MKYWLKIESLWGIGNSLSRQCNLFRSWRNFRWFFVDRKDLLSMSWAGPEDIYLSTSLASYLDSKIQDFSSFFCGLFWYMCSSSFLEVVCSWYFKSLVASLESFCAEFLAFRCFGRVKVGIWWFLFYVICVIMWATRWTLKSNGIFFWQRNNYVGVSIVASGNTELWGLDLLAFGCFGVSSVYAYKFPS